MTTLLEKREKDRERQKRYYNKHKNDENFKLKNRSRVKKYVDERKDDPIYKERRKKNLDKYNNNPDRKLKLKKYYINNNVYFKEKSRNRSRNIKLEVLYYYSNGEMKCNDCSEEHIEFLEIDHINDGGRKHKKEKHFTNINHYLKRNNFPEGYQVLCSNCNIKKVKVIARERGTIGDKNQRYRYRYNTKIKLDVLSHYLVDGEIKCSCPNCNEKDIDKLCLDHINGGGENHRNVLRKIGVVGQNIYLWIKKNKYPKIFRILCHNCNQSLGNYGYCPHDK